MPLVNLSRARIPGLAQPDNGEASAPRNDESNASDDATNHPNAGPAAADPSTPPPAPAATAPAAPGPDWFTMHPMIAPFGIPVQNPVVDPDTEPLNPPRPVVVPELERESPPRPVPGSSQRDKEEPAAKEAVSSFSPSVLDVLVVRAMLIKARRQPVEIVDQVLDLAEYWPHTSTVLDFGGPTRIFVVGSPYEENHFLLRTPPLGFIRPVHPDPEKYKTEPAKPMRLLGEHPTEQFQRWIGTPHVVQHPARKIVFTLTSEDQGWGGDPGTRWSYGGSWTWFDAGQERLDALGQCRDDCPHATGTSSQAGAPSLPANPHFCPCSIRHIKPEVHGQPHHLFIPSHIAPHDDRTIQRNLTAHRGALTHVVEWRWNDDIDPDSAEADKLEEIGRGRATGNGEFVRGLKLGDAVTVWAKARFQGWMNKVHRVQVDLYWSV